MKKVLEFKVRSDVLNEILESDPEFLDHIARFWKVLVTDSQGKDLYYIIWDQEIKKIPIE
jgi:hypothetical protein